MDPAVFCFKTETNCSESDQKTRSDLPCAASGTDNLSLKLTEHHQLRQNNRGGAYPPKPLLSKTKFLAMTTLHSLPKTIFQSYVSPIF
jgi:hypothetical protein